MALTRAQLLSGNSSQGTVLSGQVQAVSQGAGVVIAANGQISVDASTVTGLVKLNNPTAYNAYVWPNVDGTTGQFLQTDGAGNLTWATAQGYAVVTVQSGAPSPADIGELWFDCATGTLNVYQNCVGTPSPNWFNVAQPGLPVLPANTSAAPPFVSGSGTSAAPYVCNATTVPVSGSAFIVNTVSVSGLAPFQYVPIADLNGVTNGGRFTFSNYYADAGGTLTFNTIFNDVPGSPVGTVYTANIKIGYGSAYVNAGVSIVAALSTTAGSISGTPQTGQTLTYTTGVASGGTGPYTYSWIWQDDLGATLQTGGATYVVAGGTVGRTISVVLTATDAALATATATTAPTAIVTVAPFPGTVWAPTPSGGLNDIPGLISGVYSGTGTTITSTGCIEVSTDGTNFSQSKAITSGQTLYARWITSPACGGASTGTNLTGTVTDGTYQDSYAVTVNRKPTPALANVTDSNIALGAVTSKSLAAAVAGLTATAYITLDAASTGTNVRVSLDGGTTFAVVPSAPSTAMPVNNTQTIIIEQTVGSSTGVGYIAAINIGDSTGSGGAASTYQTVTYTATTVTTAVFPNSPFTPVGGPNASPASVSEPAPFMPAAIEGTATCSNWGDGSVTLTGTNMVLSIGLGVAPVSASVSPVPTDVVNVAWDPAYISGLADGATATGSFTDTTYTNSYTFTVDKQPAFTLPADPTGAALSTQQTTSAFTPNNFNCPVTVSFTSPTTGGTVAMSNVQYAINGGAAVNVTLGTTTVVINPGDSIEILGDTGATNSTTYGITVTMGAAAAQEWLVTTTAVTNAITAPTMSPTGGPLNPALNSPAGITIGGGTYTVASGAPGPHTSTDWELYEGSYPLLSTNAITAVNTVASDWTLQTSGFTSNLIWDVGYGNGVYVAVGASGQLRTSTNATSWTPVTSGFGTNSIYSVAYGGGTWVAAGGGGNISYSTNNGVSWSQNTGLTGGAQAVAYGNGLWVLVGQNGQISTSTNGIVWTPRTNPFLTNQSLTTVAYGNGLWVAGGANGQVGTSPDGINWTLRTGNIGFNSPIGLFYANGLWVMGAEGTAMVVSTDGITWTPITSPFPSGNIYAVEYSNGVWVAGGNSGIATSGDGINWTLETTPFGADTVFGLAYGNGLWVASGSSNKIATATVPGSQSSLAIAGCQTDGFLVGDTIVSNPAAAGPATITAVNNTSVTVTPQSASWAATQKIERDSSSYTQIVPPPANPNATDLETLLVPQASLTTSSTYYSRARYSASSTSTTSPWANWASFTTTSSFAIAPGTAMGGGYFAGQINDGGTVYNLIVAPVEGDNTGPATGGSLQGQYGGATPSAIQYSNPAAADLPAATSQNEVYGAGATTTFADAAHPMFDWCVNDVNGPNGSGGIGGHTDWYIPAKNELAVLYFFLKPDTTANNTGSGSNPNSVAPYTPNTSYGVGFPDVTTADGTGGTGDFTSGGSEAFSTLSYWSSTENSGSTTFAWLQGFSNGTQNSNVKTSTRYARAVRRIAA